MISRYCHWPERFIYRKPFDAKCMCKLSGFCFDFSLFGLHDMENIRKNISLPTPRQPRNPSKPRIECNYCVMRHKSSNIVVRGWSFCVTKRLCILCLFVVARWKAWALMSFGEKKLFSVIGLWFNFEGFVLFYQCQFRLTQFVSMASARRECEENEKFKAISGVASLRRKQ